MEILACAMNNGLCYEKWLVIWTVACAIEISLCYEKWLELQKFMEGQCYKNGLWFEKWPLLQQVDCATISTLWCDNWHVFQKMACAYKVACAMESGLIYNKWPVSQNVTFGTVWKVPYDIKYSCGKKFLWHEKLLLLWKMACSIKIVQIAFAKKSGMWHMPLF